MKKSDDKFFQEKKKDILIGILWWFITSLVFFVSNKISSIIKDWFRSDYSDRIELGVLVILIFLVVYRVKNMKNK